MAAASAKASNVGWFWSRTGVGSGVGRNECGGMTICGGCLCGRGETSITSDESLGEEEGMGGVNVPCCLSYPAGLEEVKRALRGVGI